MTAPVTNLDELAGTKIRVPEPRVWIAFWPLPGANPALRPCAKPSDALSIGGIEGLETAVVSTFGFHRSDRAPPRTLPPRRLLPKAARANVGVLDGLAPELRNRVRNRGVEAVAEQRQTTVRAGPGRSAITWRPA
jgi:C4-dicarboxylate-binding protein DctP